MSRFNPYGDSSGGSTLAIAGKDFLLLAGDTRHSTGYSIDSRNMTQIVPIGDGMYFAGNGFSADAKQLADDLRTRIKWYHHENNGHKMGVRAAARMTSLLMYGKRFFPYYTNPMLVGLEADGSGVIYTFDPIGCDERRSSQAGGHATQLLTPFLDNQVSFENQVDPETKEPKTVEDIDLGTAVRLVKDSFAGAAERQIQVGDTLEILVLTPDGEHREQYPLRRD